METALKTVQQVYAEFGKGNVEGVLGLLHEDVIWIDPGYPEIPYAGKRKGKPDVAGFFSQMAESIAFTRFEPQIFTSEGNRVVAQGYIAGKGMKSGKTCETEWVMIWEVVSGKIKKYQAYIDTYNVAQVYQ